jgi:hypothetical protein
VGGGGGHSLGLSRLGCRRLRMGRAVHQPWFEGNEEFMEMPPAVGPTAVVPTAGLGGQRLVRGRFGSTSIWGLAGFSGCLQFELNPNIDCS